MRQYRIVLTAGPCAGKSTLINKLQKQGYVTVSETAREVHESWQGPKDILEFQLEVAKRQLEKEKSMPCRAVFLDRGIYDGFVYVEKEFGYVPQQLIQIVGNEKRYEQILVPDLLPFQNDGLRVESGQKEAEEIHENLIATYKRLGYKTERIPILPLEQRVEYVLDLVRRTYGRK